jgi:hypothetical protein
MDLKLKEEFLRKWDHYFGKSELPIVFFYSADLRGTEMARPPKGRSCLICELAAVRKGKSLAYDKSALRCGGARRYAGYESKMRPDFEYFLSCGIPGEMEGERYIRTPGMVNELMKNVYTLPAEGNYLVFKRWDKLEFEDTPEAAVFIANPQVLSGLFTLSNFDRTDGLGVIAPFGSGCGSVIYRGYLENQEEDPKAILGMFDPSARPCVPENTLSFTIPMKKMVKMIGYMDESFLITDTWKKIFPPLI